MTTRAKFTADLAIVCTIIGVSTILLFKNALSSPNLVALGEQGIDLPAQLWILWWDNHPQRNQLVNAPFANVQFYVLTPIHNWLASVLYPKVILAHNIVSWFGLALAVLVGGMLGRRFANHRAGVVFGSLALVSSAPLIAAFRDGTGEFIWLGCLGLCVWTADVLREEASLRNGVGLFIALTVTIFCSWYYGAAALLMVLILSLYSNRSRWVLLGCIPLSVLASLLWIRDFTASDFEIRPVREGLWQQLSEGSIGPVADFGTSAIPWLARTQLSLHDAWWTDLWLWSVIPLCCIGWAAQKEIYVWATVVLLSFLVGFGSYAPNGQVLPMLYGNRLLEWFGVGMHLPFHVSAVGVLAVLVLALRAPQRYVTIASGVLLIHAGTALWQGAVWSVPIYPELQSVEGMVLHPQELQHPDHNTLNEIMTLQMSHQQPIATFPIFPTTLTRREGVNRLQADLARGMDAESLRLAGVHTLIIPQQDKIPSELQRDCTLRQIDEWQVCQISSPRQQEEP